MSTYKEVIDFVKDRYGRSAAPCYVSQCKAEKLGWPHPDRNRDGSIRKKQSRQPLTDEMRGMIYAAFDELGIPNGRRSR